jgi:hypothetical protein
MVNDDAVQTGPHYKDPSRWENLSHVVSSVSMNLPIRRKHTSPVTFTRDHGIRLC